MHTKEDVSDLLRGFNIELKEWSNKLHGPAIVIRNNKEVKVKWLSKLVYKLKARKNKITKNVTKNIFSSKEHIQVLMSKFGITLLEYGGKLKSFAKMRLSDGSIKQVTRLDKFLARLNKKLTKGSEIIPLDKRSSFIEKAKRFCIKSAVIDFIVEENERHNKVKAQCLICNNIFYKTWEEVIRTREIRCRSCKSHLNAIERHKFFYNYEQYANYTRKLTELNNIKYVNLIGKRKSQDMHLDHKLSISHAYKNHIPPWMCAAPSNLEYIPAIENLKKQIYSSVSLSDFIVSFSDFIKAHPEYLEMVKSMEDTEGVTEKELLGTKEDLLVT